MKNLLLLKILLLALGFGFKIENVKSQENPNHVHERYYWVPTTQNDSLEFSNGWKLNRESSFVTCGHDHGDLPVTNFSLNPIDLSIHQKIETLEFKFTFMDSENVFQNSLSGLTFQIISDNQLFLISPISQNNYWVLDLTNFYGKDVQIRMLTSQPELLITNTFYYESKN